jgi:hypothetical protein
MTQDEIIEMAREAGFKMENSAAIQAAEIFANLVAQEVRDRIMFGSRDDWVLAEREACAKVCENMAIEWEDQPQFAQIEIATMMDCALAIRARGDQA